MASAATFLVSGIWHELVYAQLASTPPRLPPSASLGARLQGWWEGLHTTRGLWLLFFLAQVRAVDVMKGGEGGRGVRDTPTQVPVGNRSVLHGGWTAARPIATPALHPPPHEQVPGITLERALRRRAAEKGWKVPRCVPWGLWLRSGLPHGQPAWVHAGWECSTTPVRLSLPQRAWQHARAARLRSYTNEHLHVRARRWAGRAATFTFFMAGVCLLWQPPSFWPLPEEGGPTGTGRSSSLMDRVIQQSAADVHRLGAALGAI